MLTTISIAVTEPMNATEIRDLQDACMAALNVPRLAHQWTEGPSTVRPGNMEWATGRELAALIGVIHGQGGPINPGIAKPSLPDPTYVEVAVTSADRAVCEQTVEGVGAWLDGLHFAWRKTT